MEEANLIHIDWQGRNKIHYLNVEPIGENYDRWISKYDRDRIEALRDLKKQLEAE
ncbi:MAG: hypothetical protein K0Q73_1536 [Paenibacillus sp.]|jgi:hypothetical protein|nr:hypothetical protein [Paenibacillus sp.]